MSLKDLFKKDKKNAKKPLIKKSLDTLSKEGADSSVGIEAYFEDRDRYLPLLDYTTASNFAKYGSAEEYYDVAIKRIYKNYPYDGSLYEKLEWENNSNGLDLHIFNHEYPRTNGHALFSPVGYGSINSLSGSLYASPTSNTTSLGKLALKASFLSQNSTVLPLSPLISKFEVCKLDVLQTLSTCGPPFK